MKYGIITDIHSNPIALKAVLKKFDEIKVDKILCAGDIIGIGPRPDETVQTLIKLKDKLISVHGNHEDYFLLQLPQNTPNVKISKEEIECHLWNQNQLSSSSEEFLTSLPDEIVIYDEGKKICILHYPKDENKEYKASIQGPSAEECVKLFQNYDADVFIYGHVHSKSLVIHQGKSYLNFGSLGCPKDKNVACCGVLYVDKSGIGFDMLDVEYDVDKIIKEIKNLKYPNYKEILDIFYGGR